MKYPLLFISTLCSCLLHAQSTASSKGIIYRNDFEEKTPDHGAPIRVLNNTPGSIRAVESKTDPTVASSAGANSALVLAGGKGNDHPWQPAGDIALPDLKEGYLYMGFKLKNTSTDDSLFGIQISNNTPESYQLWQQIFIHADYITLTGTGRGLGKEDVSAGADAKWMKIEWIIPSPGNRTGRPRLYVNGNDQGMISLEPLSETASQINLMRIWMPYQRGEASRFLVDDLTVAAAPSLEELAKIVKAKKGERLP